MKIMKKEIKLSKEKEEEYMNEMERIEREMKKNEGNDMNIDRDKYSIIFRIKNCKEIDYYSFIKYEIKI